MTSPAYGEAYWLPNSTNSVGLKVYDRGGPTTADTTVYLYEYFNVIQPQGTVPDTVRQDVRPPGQHHRRCERVGLRFAYGKFWLKPKVHH